MNKDDKVEKDDKEATDKPASARDKRQQHADQHTDPPRTTRNMVASVAARLLSLAHKREEDFQLVLTRYGLERLLCRLGRSVYARQFVVKGALLFALWDEQREQGNAGDPGTTSPSADHRRRPHRATHDLDLLGYGAADPARLEQVFRDLCQLSSDEEDGLAFQPETVRTALIRAEQEYGGIRVHLLALLGKARIPLQVDVGFGDVVTPPPEEIAFPTLLPDLPAPHVRVYPRETVVAEKFEAIVRLGLPNTRMKDFYNLWSLANQFTFEGDQLCAAVRATFTRRGTALPTADEEPVAFTSRFADDTTKQTQWGRLPTQGATVSRSQTRVAGRAGGAADVPAPAKRGHRRWAGIPLDVTGGRAMEACALAAGRRHGSSGNRVCMERPPPPRRRDLPRVAQPLQPPGPCRTSTRLEHVHSASARS